MNNSQDGRPRIPPGQVVTQKFPVMTAGTPRTTDKSEWTLTLDGEVENAVTLGWAAFNALPKREFVTDIHCVTKWSKLDTRWEGVDLDVLYDLVRPSGDARYVQARADGDYTANLRLADLLDGQAIVATQFDGKPLTADHGGPARLVAPRLYFWKSAKWLRGLHFSQYDYKGYWEKLGYHNYGDPWEEQRYR
ncbi:molybdopterin-dependent oxidoreductase [Tritonibacter mobilis]|uniref:molybdopterin-dependent oxidoreductase n=1 Tax=Tritonibacter mobilis TaxID=379347 RepID=UPI000806AEA5|nr:molybdopterin-dependent oxidoreductase [Tritonibacter mobilis]